MPRIPKPKKTAAKRRQPAGRKRLPLTEVAYEAIKKEILTSRLHPGDALPQDRFIRQLGLSRTPLREAILRLQREGFIEIRPRMGTFVAQLNILEIRDMYEVRRMLEGLAARHAAGAIPPERLAEVEDRLLLQPDPETADLTQLSEAGHELHRLILDHAGNRVLVRFVQSLNEHFQRFRAFSLNIRPKVLSSHQEHIRILEALKSGDGERAEQLIHSHFDHAARFLVESVLQRQPGAATVPVTARRAGTA